MTQTLNRAATVNLGGYNPATPLKPAHPSVVVDAGMTWAELHHVLLPHGLAPLVQQSSADFSIGGAVSVNCHGRDPRWGPIGNTVRWLDVLCGDGAVRRTSATVEADLFAAVVGGYGSCGLILRACLELGPNRVLDPVVHRLDLDKYAVHLNKLAARADDDSKRVQLHHGWFRCVDLVSLFDEVHVVDCKEVNSPQADTVGPLPHEEWGMTEVLRAAWDESRKGYGALRAEMWDMVMKTASRRQVGRMSLQRPAMGFAAHRGAAGCDILQEYFVPLNVFLPLVEGLRDIFRRNVAPHAPVTILSASARLLPRDRHPINLSYCPAGDQPMVSLAVEAAIGVHPASREPDAEVSQWATAAMDLAHSLGGSYYLPYFGFADRDRFRRSYVNWQRQADAIARYDPQRRFSNQFLQRYCF